MDNAKTLAASTAAGLGLVAFLTGALHLAKWIQASIPPPKIDHPLVCRWFDPELAAAWDDSKTIIMGKNISKEACAEAGFYSPADMAAKVSAMGSQNARVDTSTGFHVFEFRGTGHGTSFALGTLLGIVLAIIVSLVYRRLGCSARSRNQRKIQRDERLADLLEKSKGSAPPEQALTPSAPPASPAPLQPWAANPILPWLTAGAAGQPQQLPPLFGNNIVPPPATFHIANERGNALHNGCGRRCGRDARARDRARFHGAELAGHRVHEMNDTDDNEQQPDPAPAPARPRVPVP